MSIARKKLTLPLEKWGLLAQSTHLHCSPCLGCYGFFLLATAGWAQKCALVNAGIADNTGNISTPKGAAQNSVVEGAELF